MSTVQDDLRQGAQLESEPRREAPRTAPRLEQAERTIAEGFSADVIASAGAVVLAILGLAGLYPAYLAPVAVIAIGAALLLKSGSVASRLNQLSRAAGSPGAQAELAGGMSAELYAGAGGIALGVLALVGIVPMTLMAVSVIVFGGALLFGGGETYRLNQATRSRQFSLAEYATRVSAETAGGGESLVGIGAVVLGILALTGVAPMTLVLVGLLSLSGAAFLSAFASSAHMAALLRR
jgi:hypothetical protein